MAGAPDVIGRYRIEGVLGAGGMGVVYAARDAALGRAVALKTIAAAAMADEQAQKRFWREARAAASVNHPNVCQIYEVGEADGTPFIAMEMLEGEPLSARIGRGALPVREALEATLGILAALSALHRREVIHRDLKPQNVFLTPHGVKLLDFGLARSVDTEIGNTASLLTRPGTIMGTPRYMAPEQLRGEEADPRTDLFAVAAILFEMLTGRAAFGGRTAAEVFHATLHEHPPALAGSPCVAAVDLVVRRALSKPRDGRPASAEAMLDELRRASALEDSGSAPRARAMTRLMVLPFRMLRPDPDVDFLASSVPEAIASALGAVESLVVRSSVVAARHAAAEPDLKRIAAEAEVDVVLTGTLLRAGDQIRAATQLVEAPGGTLVWSHTATVGLKDVFQLQDELTTRIVEGLEIPLTAREQRRLHGDVPATPAAYEYYLRANRVAADAASWDLAKELYEKCVQSDPRFAPGWARLGRVYRLMSKYYGRDAAANLDRAEGAFRRALELNPDLPVAHQLYTHFEVEAGRAESAMRRLIGRARAGTADPELFGGLVTATRYCGLLEASVAADRHARRLDPAARTSVSYTHWLRGEYELAFEREMQAPPWMKPYSLAEMGRTEEAVVAFAEIAAALRSGGAAVTAYRHALEGNAAGVREGMSRMMAEGFRDPEGLFFAARALARVGAREESLALLDQLGHGYFVPDVLARDAWLAPLRTDPRMQALIDAARERKTAAEAAYREAGGPQLLGV
jgi:TolB-like protein/tetratricopeptide (TPR) repeat protein/predicted Ser/Thr protein kinase